MTKKRFVFSTFLIAATSLLLKCAGLFFRIYLTDKIGTEGMGLYQLIFSVYVFLISLSSSGVSLAITRAVSEIGGTNKNGSKRYIVTCGCIYVLCTFFAVLIFVSIFAQKICLYLLHDLRCTECIKILSLSLGFIGFSAVFKGYFTAEGKVVRISISQIAEDFVKITSVILMFEFLGKIDIVYACKIIMSSIVISEICSCALLYSFYKSDIHSALPIKNKKASKRLISSIITISVGAIVTSLLRTAENILIPSGLLKYGSSSKHALSMYGMLRGMALPLMLFPSSVISAFSTLLVPEITRSKESGNKNKTRLAIQRVFQYTFIISFLIFGIFMAYSEKIGFLFYKNEEVGKIIKILSPILPFMYADGVVFACLTGLDMQKTALSITLLDSLARVAAIYFFVPKIGFSGIIATMYMSNLATPIIGALTIFMHTKSKIRPLKTIFIPSLIAFLGSKIATALFWDNLFVGITSYSIFYIATICSANVLSHDDIAYIKSFFK